MTDVEQINLAVAAIAGWTDIKEWKPNPKRGQPIKIYWQGTNEAYPELGVFIPNYAESLDAITAVFKRLKICYRLVYLPAMHGTDSAFWATNLVSTVDHNADTEALALCKLLLMLNPDPIKPVPKTETSIESESKVMEIEFV